MMNITYTVGDGLYLNITNRCTNNCDFCIRKNADGAYGSDSLWLEREPTLDEIKEAIDLADPDNYSEIVFCGYGEPTCRLFDMLLICKWLRGRYPNTKIRLNTNGHASLIAGYEVEPFFEGCFDVVSVSLNNSTPEGYDAICHSVYGKDALAATVEFAKGIKPFVPEVIMSVVRESLTNEELSECQRICEDIGVAIKIRAYIGPTEPTEK